VGGRVVDPRAVLLRTEMCCPWCCSPQGVNRRTNKRNRRRKRVGEGEIYERGIMSTISRLHDRFSTNAINAMFYA
jgi:hypothetical protein